MKANAMKQPLSKTGISLFIVFFVIYFLSHQFARNFLLNWLAFPHYSPSNEPPWYFIHQDMAIAIAQGIGLFLILLLSAFFRKNDPFYANMAAWQASLWMGYPTFWGVIILLNTQLLFDPEAATTVWQTQKAYLNSSSTFTFAYIAIWGVLSFYWRKWYKSALKTTNI